MNGFLVRTRALASGALLFALAAVTVEAQVDGFCQRIEYPGAVAGTTWPFAINNAGDVVGSWASEVNPDEGTAIWHGFLLSEGKYTTIDYPGAVNTFAHGINDAGDIVGFTSYPGRAHGFLRRGGAFSAIDYDNDTSLVTSAYDINNAGQVVGEYHGGPDLRSHGFFLSEGAFSTIDVPGIRHGAAWGLNDAGLVVGWAADGFRGTSFRWQSGALSPFDGFPGSYATEAYGINNDGKIVGMYATASPSQPGFVLAEGEYGSFNCNDAFGTTVHGINDKGAMVGRYFPFDGSAVGFVSPPVSLLDPVPDLLSGPGVTTDTELLAAKGRDVQGVVADGVAQVLLRIPVAEAGVPVTVTLMNDRDPPVESDSVEEDGALGRPGVPCCDRSQVTVPSVNTSRGPFAFALYRAPVDFPRASGQDADRVFREVSIRVEPSSTTITAHRSAQAAQATVPVKVLRPPVVMIHGLWDNWRTWDNFSPLVTGRDTVDARFSVLRVNFDAPIGAAITASEPAYATELLRDKARSSALGFKFNARAVLGQITPWLNDFKAARNRANVSVAAVQADVVAHSMGGDVARTMTLQPGYGGDRTFGEGVIHKLITVDTPHLGSPLATRMLSTTESVRCLQDFLAGNGNVPFRTVTLRNAGLVEGAVGDFIHSPPSQALRDMAGSSRRIPTAMIAGIYTKWDALDCTICVANYIRNKCDHDPLAQALTEDGWPGVFGEPSDAIVPLSSQWSGLSGRQVDGVCHSPGTEWLSFDGPNVLDPNRAAHTVIELLNTEVTNTSQYRLLP